MPTLFVVFISFLVIRAASIALMMTGMDEKRARFQAISAFTGTGFTTKEAEYVVNRPERRRIISWLMILGNAGIVTVIVTATSSFVVGQERLFVNVLILFVGVFVIYRIGTNKGFIRRWEGFIENKLAQASSFEEGITEDLLHLLEGYGLLRVIIKKNSQLVSSSLLEHKLTTKGLLVLGIERDKKWMPIPKANEIINVGDKLVVYGPLDIIKSIFKHEPIKSEKDK